MVYFREMIFPHRRQQIPLISSIPGWMKTGFHNHPRQSR
jgi:hypothetical protein